MDNLYSTGIRKLIDEYLLEKSKEERDYGDYWSASSAGYCQRKLLFERLKLPSTHPDDARKTRVFEVGNVFHNFMQDITRNANISVAQEKEIRDDNIMVRGHFDDLVLINDKLILYDYKTQNSRAFTYQKGKPISYYHKMQLITYLYMLHNDPNIISDERFTTKDLSEGRVLKISKDDLRMTEQQLIWSDELEKDVLDYWNTLNNHWNNKTIPPCTCNDHEGGFMAKEAYNPYFYNGEPCSIEWYKKCKVEGLIK